MSAELVRGLDRWLACPHAVVIQGGEPQVGFNENYSCKNHEVVDRVTSRSSVKAEQDTDEEGNLFSAIRIYARGRTETPWVQSNLDLGCGRCPFFEEREKPAK